MFEIVPPLVNARANYGAGTYAPVPTDDVVIERAVADHLGDHRRQVAGLALGDHAGVDQLRDLLELRSRP